MIVLAGTLYEDAADCSYDVSIIFRREGTSSVSIIQTEGVMLTNIINNVSIISHRRKFLHFLFVLFTREHRVVPITPHICHSSPTFRASVVMIPDLILSGWVKPQHVDLHKMLQW